MTFDVSRVRQSWFSVQQQMMHEISFKASLFRFKEFNCTPWIMLSCIAIISLQDILVSAPSSPTPSFSLLTSDFTVSMPQHEWSSTIKIFDEYSTKVLRFSMLEQLEEDYWSLFVVDFELKKASVPAKCRDNRRTQNLNSFTLKTSTTKARTPFPIDSHSSVTAVRFPF